MKKLKRFGPAVATLLILTVVLSGCLSTLLLANRDAAPVESSAATEDADYMAKLEEIVALLDEVYIDGYDTEALGDYLAEAAVAATGDRWSYYISAEDMAAYEEDKNNAYVGIGVTVTLSEGGDGITITDVTPDGPADLGGLKIGDVIVAVEGESTAALGMDETKNRIRGEEGTEVTLTIRRDGTDLEVTLTRATIAVQVVKYELLDGGVGYIKIANFNENCARDAIAAIEVLMAQGARGLVFDVRYNPGGYKSELVALLDYILPEGPLFRAVDYTGAEDVDYSDADCIDIPMAVLINGDSYSAAEFFAAALQEYGVATVVGTQTTGKANFQNTFVLSDGSAVAVSVGHYQTPNGVTLEGVGVTPDKIVEVDEETYYAIYYGEIETSEDVQLQTAISALPE
ncbi:MAG: S41 family peptidase [Oscillospiraceae bacterium]|nr:S41 family peptidase [Oscillospiraceae bacterium]